MIKIKENIHYPIKISYENKIYETTVYSTINISQLRQKIFQINYIDKKKC